MIRELHKRCLIKAYTSICVYVCFWRNLDRTEIQFAFIHITVKHVGCYFHGVDKTALSHSNRQHVAFN